MSFDWENWGDARGKASEKLFQSLRSRPKNPTTTSLQRPAFGSSQRGTAGSATRDGVNKRKRQDGMSAEELSVANPFGGVYIDVSGDTIRTLHSSPVAADNGCDEIRNEARPEKRQKSQASSSIHTDIFADAALNTGAGAVKKKYVGFERISIPRPSAATTTPAPRRKPAASSVVDLTLSDDDEAASRTRVSKPASKQSQSQPLQQKKLPTLTTQPKPKSPAEIPSLGTCSCGKPVLMAEIDQVVQCAGSACKVGRYHRACVGLASRKITEGWRCYPCRPKPPPSSTPVRSSQMPRSSQLPSSSQTAPSSQQPPSSPPTMTVIPRSAPLPPPSHGEPEPPLHPEQARVVDCIMQGGNVFYTGSAGTGKSTVLKSFVQRLKDQGKCVDIVAPSGIAALNVGGMTIFAYAGWHPDSFKEPLHEFVRKSHGKNVRKRLCRTDVLVIDEISMVERDLLVRLDTMMREVRTGWKPEKGEKRMSKHGQSFPFGGAQVIITGDFCQLPPVKPFKFCITCGGDELPGHARQDGKPLTCKRCKRAYKDEDKWAFKSEAWRACKFTCFELRHIHRQSDKRFIDILQKCRYGQPLLPADKSALLTVKPDPVGAVKLLPRREEVNAENSRNFNGLRSTQRTYTCLDTFMWRNRDEPELQVKGAPRYPNQPDGPLKALQDHRFEEQVRLKEGMLVILLVNLDFKTGLVNGSQGKIIGFEKHSEYKVFPPKAPDSPGKGSGRGLGKDSAPKSDYTAIREDQVRNFISRNNITQWPVIEFHNGVVQPIYAHCQLSELGSEKPYSLLGRTQMPLLAAWAITVHKSQGMTLNRVIVDLYNSFEREMVYVALSRARSLEGLKVVRLARGMDQGVNEEVQGFLRGHGLGGC